MVLHKLLHLRIHKILAISDNDMESQYNTDLLFQIHSNNGKQTPGWWIHQPNNESTYEEQT